MTPVVVLALVPLVPLAAIVLGVFAAWAIGRPAQFWRISLPLFLAIASILVVLISWPPRLGVDLAGGTLLVYEVRAPDDEPDVEQAYRSDEVLKALRRRVDPGGVGDVDVRSNQDGQIEFRVPAGREDAVAWIQQIVSACGFLEFRIVADEQLHERLCGLAEKPGEFEEKTVEDESGRILGRWVRVEESPEGAISGRFSPEELKHMVTRKAEDSTVEVLTVEDKFRVTGNHLSGVSPGCDAQGNPILNFSMTRRGAVLFGALTGANMPDHQTGHRARLGIILDGELLSAPNIVDRIADRGQITGRFTREEIEFLVGILKAGRLPSILNLELSRVSRFDGDQRLRWAQWSLIGTLTALLLLGAFAVVLFGGRGGVSFCTTLLTALMLTSGVLATRLGVTFATVFAACIFVLVLAIGLVVFSRPAKAQPNGGRPLGTALASLLSPRVLIAFGLLGFVLVAGAATYAVGMGEIRRIGAIVAIASLAAMVSTVCCFWPLLGLFASPPKSDEDSAGVVTADLAE
jgi:SecD/SecF fusion protein